MVDGGWWMVDGGWMPTNWGFSTQYLCHSTYFWKVEKVPMLSIHRFDRIVTISTKKLASNIRSQFLAD